MGYKFEGDTFTQGSSSLGTTHSGKPSLFREEMEGADRGHTVTRLLVEDPLSKYMSCVPIIWNKRTERDIYITLGHRTSQLRARREHCLRQSGLLVVCYLSWGLQLFLSERSERACNHGCCKMRSLPLSYWSSGSHKHPLAVQECHFVQLPRLGIILVNINVTLYYDMD